MLCCFEIIFKLFLKLSLNFFMFWKACKAVYCRAFSFEQFLTSTLQEKFCVDYYESSKQFYYFPNFKFFSVLVYTRRLIVFLMLKVSQKPGDIFGT